MGTLQIVKQAEVGEMPVRQSSQNAGRGIFIMIKKLSVVGLTVFALAGLGAAPASAAGGCVSLYANVNGTELVNQNVCTP